MDIYFSDLNTDAQKRLMEETGISDPKEANWDLDIVPIASIEFELEHEDSIAD